MRQGLQGGKSYYVKKREKLTDYVCLCADIAKSKMLKSGCHFELPQQHNVVHEGGGSGKEVAVMTVGAKGKPGLLWKRGSWSQCWGGGRWSRPEEEKEEGMVAAAVMGG